MLRIPEAVESRIARRVAIDEYSGCWNWQGAITPNGYGTMGVGSKVDGSKRTEYVHRLSYLTHVGPIPPGLELDHLCRNRACANPAHLEPVTRRENTMRGLAPTKCGSQNRIKTQCTNGHPFNEQNTYHRPTGGRTCRQCQNDRRLAKFRQLRDVMD